MTTERICVYTALFGHYERLNSQPVAADSDVDWICFTDDPDLAHDDWEVVVVKPSFALDPVRSARRIKLLPPSQVRDYEVSIWIDNSVVLDADPRAIVSHWLQDNDISFPSHSYRSTVLDEFLVVLDDQLDDPARITEQLEHYARTRPESLEQRPFWTAIVPRRWTPPVDEAMHVWWEQVLRYSRRDQLSLVHSLDSVGLVPHRVEIDNFESDWHRWPVAPERNGTIRTRTTDAALRRPVARVFELEHEVAQLRDQLAGNRVDVDKLRSDLEATRGRELDHERARNAAELRLVHLDGVELPALTAEIDRLRESLAGMHQLLESVLAERSRLERSNTDLLREREELGRRITAVDAELEAIRASRSWRIARGVSRPVHAVVDPLLRR